MANFYAAAGERLSLGTWDILDRSEARVNVRVDTDSMQTTNKALREIRAAIRRQISGPVVYLEARRGVTNWSVRVFGITRRAGGLEVKTASRWQGLIDGDVISVDGFRWTVTADANGVEVRAI